MAISFTKPVFNNTPPEAYISKDERLRLIAENDTRLNAVGTAVDSLVTQVNAEIDSSNIKFTTEGGLAVKLVNKTGAATVKGTVVSAATGTNGAFILTAVDAVDPLGVVYEAGVADASSAWVVVSGKAQVLFTTNVTRGQFARGPVAGDTGEQAGYAVAGTPPANPNIATEDHFREIGHCLESTTAGALTYVMLHFN